MRHGFLFYLCMLFFLAAGKANAADKPAELLQKAWNEYGFQNWEMSKRLFLQTLSGKAASEEQRLQARIGLAFLNQFRMPGRDPEKAIGAYEAILKEIPESNKHVPMLYMNLGYCMITKEKKDFSKAHEYFEKALALSKDKKSLIAQQTILRYLASYLVRPDSKEIAEGLKKADELLPLVKGTMSAGPAHRMAADMAYCLGDVVRYEKELEAQYNAGIGNRSIKEDVILSIARLNDVKFKNYEKAKKFYSIIPKELPSGRSAYYCKLRVEELSKGIKESKITAPPYEKKNGIWK